MKPTEERSAHDDARRKLIAALATRRRMRVLYDARNSTAIEEEIESLLIFNEPFDAMTDEELVAIWEELEDRQDEEDPSESGYEAPELDLTLLRSGGLSKEAGGQDEDDLGRGDGAVP